jgi:hypothetical protein
LKLEVDDEMASIDLNRACLCFQAFVVNEFDGTFVAICEPVYSTPIRNSLKRSVGTDLMINSVVPSMSSAYGGTEAVILCETIDADDLTIRFYETNEHQEVVWQSEVDISARDIHKNSAIKFTTPSYHSDINGSPVTVQVQLVSRSVGKPSNSVTFVYLPTFAANSETLNASKYE